MLTLQVNSKTYAIPSKLEELSPRQFLLCLPYLFGEGTTEERASVGYQLLPPAVRRRLPEFNDEQRAEVLLQMTSWVGKPTAYTPFKSFRFRLVRYYLPRVERLSTIEAAKAQQFHELWHRTRKEEYLDLLVATLCRPRRLWIRLAPWARDYATKWDGDERERYNAEIVSRRAKRFSKLPLQYKLAAFWHFSQSMQAIHRQFLPVFQHRTEDSKPGPLLDMVFHLSGAEFGDYVSVSHTPLITALYLLKTRLL